MRTFIFVILAFVCVCYGLKAPPREGRKKLAGPPSEYSKMQIPTLEEVASITDYTVVNVFMNADSTGKFYEWHGTYNIDTHDKFEASLLTPHLDVIELYVKPPHYEDYYKIDATFFDQKQVRGYISEGPFGIDGLTHTARSFSFYDIEAGEYEIKLITTKPITQNPGKPDAAFILDSYSNFKLFCHVNSYDLEEGESIGLVAQIFDEEDPSWSFGDEGRPTALQGVIETAMMEVTLPDGEVVDVDMKDDGMSDDLEANDGIYGATIPALEIGSYIYTAHIKGTTPSGYAFTRTSIHLLEIVAPQMTLTGVASQSYDTKTKTISFNVHVDLVEEDVDEDGSTVFVFAELWGTDSSGLEYVPVAWMEMMADPEKGSDGDLSLILEVDESWVHLAEASLPFQLRDVRVMDRNSFGILSRRSEIFVKNADETSVILSKVLEAGRANQLRDKLAITEKMLFGPRPSFLIEKEAAMRNRTTAEAKPTLLLVHGYCSGTVWDPEDFTNAIEFQDYKASRSNDQFAQRVLEFAEKNDLDSYGFIGHSQGGMVGNHLHSFYWSGLDISTGAKRVQSVGTPYQGCSLAGNLAALGSVFGAGCGSNYDLSVTGAKVWAPTIPTSITDYTYYYTTTYPDGWFVSNCMTGTSIVLHAPNDGTTEITYSNIDGAHNMGTTKSQCHTSGMNYMAQTSDKTRNAEMNKAAAR